MKKCIIALLLSALSVAAMAAPKNYILLHDSIGADVAHGTSAQHYTTLVSTERNVLIRNLSSPGASLGSTDKTGFNNSFVTNAINQISGAYSYYDGVIIAAGTNDFGRSINYNETVTGLRKILAKVKADGKKAIVLDLIYRDGETVPNGQGNTLAAYRYVMSLVCVNEYPDMCHFANRDGSGLDVQTNDYSLTEIAASKRLHPNVAGHRKLADWVKAEAAAAGYF